MVVELSTPLKKSLIMLILLSNWQLMKNVAIYGRFDMGKGLS